MAITPLALFCTALFPFLFFGSERSFVEACLAGVESCEWENNELPSLRQDSISRSFERGDLGNRENGQVPAVWQPEIMERREKENCFWGIATLLLPKLRSSLFAVVSCSSLDSFFFQVLHEILKEDTF
jgi:hypothetical protein